MEDNILKKLNFKAQKQACVLRAPSAFSASLSILKQMAQVDELVDENATYDFVLLFAEMKTDIALLFNQLKTKLEPDALLWVAYPKKSSRKYQSDISRDDGWQLLGDAGFEGVRQIAIDDDWSALRFRKTEFIKTMKRDQKMAMSKKGKERTKNSD